MASGPWHYREAERLIEEANHVGHHDPQRGDGILLAAQVHATLALAAATAINDAEGGLPIPDWEAWQATASETRQDKASEGEE